MVLRKSASRVRELISRITAGPGEAQAAGILFLESIRKAK